MVLRLPLPHQDEGLAVRVEKVSSSTALTTVVTCAGKGPDAATNFVECPRP